MLDDTDQIKKLDAADALGVIRDQPKQLQHAFIDVDIDLADVKTIVVAAMGGSALGAEFFRTWLADRLPLPVVIVRDYALPAYVGPDTLVICSSYSGNTEETLSALADAERRGAKIVIFTAGGKLLQAAQEKGYPHFQIPGGLQPRLAILYGTRALAQLLQSAGLVKGIVTELEAGAQWASGQVGQWGPETATADNRAKQIAMELEGHAVVVYGGTVLSLPAMKWKIDINENSKGLAFYNYIPEFSHNEFLGWSQAQRADAFKVVMLTSSLDHPQILKRFEISPRLVSETMPAPVVVAAEGSNRLEHMLHVLLLGDFVSAYFAFLKGLDPTPVELIEKMKAELA